MTFCICLLYVNSRGLTKLIRSLPDDRTKHLWPPKSIKDIRLGSSPKMSRPAFAQGLFVIIVVFIPVSVIHDLGACCDGECLAIPGEPNYLFRREYRSVTPPGQSKISISLSWRSAAVILEGSTLNSAVTVPGSNRDPFLSQVRCLSSFMLSERQQ